MGRIRLVNRQKRLHHNNDDTYVVRMSDITIQKGWNRVRKDKMNSKWNYFNRTGNMKEPIVLDRDFVLVDGFTSYKIAKRQHMKYVDVCFE